LAITPRSRLRDDRIAEEENEFDVHRRRCDLPLQILTAAPLLQAAVTKKQVPSRVLDDSLVATTPPSEEDVSSGSMARGAFLYSRRLVGSHGFAALFGHDDSAL
jgi:hypothetical protein